AAEPEVIALPSVPQEVPQVSNTEVEEKEPEPQEPEIITLPDVPQEALPASNTVVEEKEPEAAAAEPEVIQEVIENEKPAVDTTRADYIRDILDKGDVFNNLNALVRNSAITPVINQNLVKF